MVGAFYCEKVWLFRGKRLFLPVKVRKSVTGLHKTKLSCVEYENRKRYHQPVQGLEGGSRQEAPSPHALLNAEPSVQLRLAQQSSAPGRMDRQVDGDDKMHGTYIGIEQRSYFLEQAA